MREFAIFSSLREFVTLFGSKREENELATPRLRFRELDGFYEGSAPGNQGGYGKF